MPPEPRSARQVSGARARQRPARRTRSSPRAGLDRATVLAAAEQLADAHGLSALTLRELAAVFGVQPPSLYNHVAGLPELKRELRLRGTRQLGQRFARASAGQRGAAAVRGIARAYRLFAREHPGLYQAALSAPDPDDAELVTAAKETAEIVFAVLSGYDLSGPDLVHATRALRATLHGFIALEQAGGFGMPVDLEESYQQCVELFISGLAARAR